MILKFELGKWYVMKSSKNGGMSLSLKEIRKNIHICFPSFFKVNGITGGCVTSIISGETGREIPINKTFDDFYRHWFTEFTHSELTKFEKGHRYYRFSGFDTDALLHLGKGNTSFRNYLNGNAVGSEGNTFTVVKVDKDGNLIAAYADKSVRLFNQQKFKIPAYMAAFFREVLNSEQTNDLVSVPSLPVVSDEDLKLLEAVKILINYRDVYTSKDRWGLSVIQGEYSRETKSIDAIVRAGEKRRQELATYKQRKLDEIESAKKLIENMKDI